MGTEQKTVGLSKSRIILHRQCPKRLWLECYRRDLAVEDPAVTARLQAGHHVGEIARGLFPGGVLVDGNDLKEALATTERLLRATPRVPIFEATVQSDGVLVRADVMEPARRGYHLIEVKSSTSVKEYHLADAAIQSWIMRAAGVTIARTVIAHIDNRFVYRGEGDYRGVLAYADISADVKALGSEIPAWIAAARKTLGGKEEPEVEPGQQCDKPFACPFQGYCRPAPDAGSFPVGILPWASALVERLREDGYEDLRDVPEERLDNPIHWRVRQASVSGEPLLDPEAKTILARLAYPRYYLDFETVQFAVPIWKGTRPYQQLPFQWSCHREAREGAGLEHSAFLSEDEKDPRRAFAESLLAAVGKRGAILVYNAAFERGRLVELAETFKDLAESLEAVCDRLVDLLPIARAHYYHPAMMGSWSIKALLPTIDPGLSYDGMTVGDGGMAQQAFLEMVHPESDAGRRRELRKALLAYCARDTLAMVRVAHHFQGFGPTASRRPRSR